MVLRPDSKWQDFTAKLRLRHAAKCAMVDSAAIPPRHATEFKMTDTTTNEKVARQAKHELIAAKGGEAVEITQAKGIRYTDIATSEVFEFVFDSAEPGSPITMLALFGAKTKATNEASRVRNGQGGDSKAQMEAIDEVFDSIAKGVWREKAEGGGGSRTDKPLLAQVLIEMLGGNAKGDVAHYVKRFEDDLKYMQQVLKSDAGVKYRERAGKKGPEIATLA